MNSLRKWGLLPVLVSLAFAAECFADQGPVRQSPGRSPVRGIPGGGGGGQPLPEPITMVLLGLGAGGVGLAVARHRRGSKRRDEVAGS